MSTLEGSRDRNAAYGELVNAKLFDSKNIEDFLVTQDSTGNYYKVTIVCMETPESKQHCTCAETVNEKNNDNERQPEDIHRV
jgi:hypothetical protein